MRIIKFRAWDKENKKFVFIEIKDNKLNFKTYPIQKNTILNPEVDPNWQQFTGLLDRHGKEIYEGDILQSFINGYPKKGVMIFDKTRTQFGFNTEVEDEATPDHVVLHDKPEIIGNIYENPELLK